MCLFSSLYSLSARQLPSPNQEFCAQIRDRTEDVLISKSTTSFASLECISSPQNCFATKDLKILAAESDQPLKESLIDINQKMETINFDRRLISSPEHPLKVNADDTSDSSSNQSFFHLFKGEGYENGHQMPSNLCSILCPIENEDDILDLEKYSQNSHNYSWIACSRRFKDSREQTYTFLVAWVR